MTATDTSKTGLNYIYSGQPLTEEEKLLLQVSAHIENVAMYGRKVRDVMPLLKEGDPYWTQAYEHVAQIKVISDAIKDELARRIPTGTVIRFYGCGKSGAASRIADLQHGCDDASCAFCYPPSPRWGIIHSMDVVGTE